MFLSFVSVIIFSEEKNNKPYVSFKKKWSPSIPVYGKTTVYSINIFSFFKQSRCFQLYIIKSNAVMDTSACAWIYTCPVISFWQVSRNGTVGSNITHNIHSTAFWKGCTNLSLPLLENEAHFSALSLDVGMIVLLNLSQHYRYNTGSRSCFNQYVTVWH